MNRTINEGRTIGNGVIIAYAILAVSTVALVALDGLNPTTVVGILAFVWMTLFAGDMGIQWVDMNQDEDGDTA